MIFRCYLKTICKTNLRNVEDFRSCIVRKYKNANLREVNNRIIKPY